MTIFTFKKPHRTGQNQTAMNQTAHQTATNETAMNETTANPADAAQNSEDAAAASANSETAGDAARTDPQAALQDELASWKDKSFRLAAEMDNLRKRSQREQEDAVKYGLTSAARSFLHVADNLERALNAVTDRAELPDPVLSLLSGIEATQTEMLSALNKMGVTPIPVRPGDALDPQIHEVMFDTPSQDHPPGRVLYIMETGYRLHDRLLRPARVAVSKAAAAQNGDAMDVSV